MGTLGQHDSAVVRRFSHTTVPTSAPTPAVTPIANALQSVTRNAPVITSAPPTLAETPPRNSRQMSEAATVHPMR